MAFFSESKIRFSNLQNKLLQITTLNLKFLPITINNLFQFQAQDSDLDYSFWQCEKHNALSEKEPPINSGDTRFFLYLF